MLLPGIVLLKKCAPQINEGIRLRTSIGLAVKGAILAKKFKVRISQKVVGDARKGVQP